MYYFDNKYLAQYLDQRVKLSVYVDQDWLTLADKRDVSNPAKGVGYDVYGNAAQFDYRDIEQIRAGKTLVTVDMLQQQRGAQPQTTDEESKDDTEETDVTDLGGEPTIGGAAEEEPATDSKEKETDLSWFAPAYDVGRQLIREFKKSK